MPVLYDYPNIVWFLDMKLISEMKDTYHSAQWFMPIA